MVSHESQLVGSHFSLRKDAQRLVTVEKKGRDEICLSEIQRTDFKFQINYPLMGHMVSPAKNELVLTHLADRSLM